MTDPTATAPNGDQDRIPTTAATFYRGEKGEWDALYCDRIIESGDACDTDPAYFIEWRQTPDDGGTLPVSGSCETHALDVDRRQVVRISTHPRLAATS